MKCKWLIGLAVLTFAACNGDSPTGPSPQDSAVSTGSVQSAAVDTAPAVAEPAPSGLNIKIKNDGTVVNNTGTTYTACLFDAPYGEGTLVDEWKAKPGVTSSDYQSDVCEPIVAQIDIIEGGQCPPTPHGLVAVAANPNVTIPAFGGNWEKVEPVRENVSEWSECIEGLSDIMCKKPKPEPICTPEKRSGYKTRTFELVTYEVNSCTEKAREVLREAGEESKKCSFETGEKTCDTNITHTENKKYCGWLGCSNKYYWGSSLKWQCQSVPPGVPGHYDNHFGKNGHDDFFGEPTSDKCYEIRN